MFYIHGSGDTLFICGHHLTHLHERMFDLPVAGVTAYGQDDTFRLRAGQTSCSSQSKYSIRVSKSWLAFVSGC